MTDAQQGAASGQLMDIGTVAAHNIVNQLGLAEDKVDTVRQAIRDEISAMSSHFTLAVADVETHYQVETTKLQEQVKNTEASFVAQFNVAKKIFEDNLAQAKSDATFLKAHKPFFSIVIGVSLAVGLVVGHLV